MPETVNRFTYWTDHEGDRLGASTHLDDLDRPAVVLLAVFNDGRQAGVYLDREQARELARYLTVASSEDRP